MASKNIESMDLKELFDESDRIGDKYLTEVEIQERDAQLEAAKADLAKVIDQG